MLSPQWLQELRDMLAIETYESRQQAMMTWERRWLVELHAGHVVSQDKMVASRINPLAHAAVRISDDLGRKLADIMVEMHREDGHHPDVYGFMGVEVRGDVMAIRRKPNDEQL